VRHSALLTLHSEVNRICDSGSDDQLGRCVTACQCAVAAAPARTAACARDSCWTRALLVLVTRFERSGNADDLTAMVDARCEAADACQPATRSTARSCRWRLAACPSGTSTCRHRPISIRDRHRSGCAAGRPAGPCMVLSNLGLSLRLRYELCGELKDLAGAVAGWQGGRAGRRSAAGWLPE